MEGLIALVRPQADAGGVGIREYHPEVLPAVRADPELFTRTLVNLALNAIQAMERGGKPERALESAEGKVSFSMSDTGPGIAPEQLDRIFQPFYTTKHLGTGLVLAITRGIVERHGGHIEIESVLGEGSTFTFGLTTGP